MFILFISVTIKELIINNITILSVTIWDNKQIKNYINWIHSIRIVLTVFIFTILLIHRDINIPKYLIG